MKLAPTKPILSTVPLTLVAPTPEAPDGLARFQQAAQRERIGAMARLSENLAHELNNPLHAIASYANLARRGAIPPEKLEHYLDEISRSVARCNAVIQSLRDFATRPVEEGSATVVDLALESRAAVAHIMSLRSTSSERPDVTLQVLEERSAACIGNRAALRRVIEHILENALEAAGESGVVLVQVEPTGEDVRVSVEDSGPGMPAHMRALVFEPFYSANARPTPKTETPVELAGSLSELSLSACHAIAREHGGTMSISDSRSLGGARVVLRLPACL